MSEKVLNGRVALVTGLARGIGRASALKLAFCGAKVVINDMPRNELISGVVREIQTLGGQAMAAPANVADSGEVKGLVKQVISEWGKIDILVNNAAIERNGFALVTSEKDWDDMFDVNLRPPFIMVKYALRHMLDLGRGRVINISSLAGIIGNAGRTGYSATKGGLIAFTRSLAREVGPSNITVNAIAPGLIITEMVSLLPQEEKDGIMSRLAIRRFGKPKEVAELVAFFGQPCFGLYHRPGDRN
ncbi:3-oxoacyl-ACP reductase family protein [Chloroflexota bacterium]